MQCLCGSSSGSIFLILPTRTQVITKKELHRSLQVRWHLKDYMTLEWVYGPYTVVELQQDMVYSSEFMVHLVLQEHAETVPKCIYAARHWSSGKCCF